MIMMMGSSRWCLPYVVVHGIGGLVAGSSVCRLGGLSARQGWAAVMIKCCLLGIGLVRAG